MIYPIKWWIHNVIFVCRAFFLKALKGLRLVYFTFDLLFLSYSKRSVIVLYTYVRKYLVHNIFNRNTEL
jgi:hypothetical protein